MELRLEHGRLHYEVYGGGETVLFLNGFGSGISNWYPVIRNLKKDHRCVLFDYVGTGDSESIGTNRYSLDAYCEDIESLMVALGVERAHLVGYSMGGWVAQHYAARHPGRIESLSLVNSSARISRHQYHVITYFIESLRQLGLEVFSRLMFISYYSPEFFERSGSHMDQIIKLSGAAFQKQSPSNWGNILESCLPFDGTGSLSDHKFPVQLVSGETDFLCPRSSAMEFTRLAPSAEWIEFPAVGHAIPMERHRDLQATIQGFLARCR